jgi:hypothetical protein
MEAKDGRLLDDTQKLLKTLKLVVEKTVSSNITSQGIQAYCKVNYQSQTSKHLVEIVVLYFGCSPTVVSSVMVSFLQPRHIIHPLQNQNFLLTAYKF